MEIIKSLSEGRYIQWQLQEGKRGKNERDKLTSSFFKLMRKGKVKAALRLLTNQKGMILNVNSPLNKEGGDDRTVLDELKAKHPPKGPICKEAVLEDCGIEFHSVIFDSIDGDTIQRAALNTNGAAGPSGIDAEDGSVCAPHSNMNQTTYATAWLLWQRN